MLDEFGDRLDFFVVPILAILASYGTADGCGFASIMPEHGDDLMTYIYRLDFSNCTRIHTKKDAR